MSLEFITMWKMANGNAYGEKFSQPVLTRWEHTSFSVDQFLKTHKGFHKLGKDVMCKEKSESKRHKIATDLVNLIDQETLIAMVYFESGFCKEFWTEHLSLIHKADSIAQQSG